MNIEHLKNTLYQLVIQKQINLDDPIVSNTRHLEALQNSHQSLSEVLNGMSSGITSDFIAYKAFSIQTRLIVYFYYSHFFGLFVPYLYIWNIFKI